jgi:hypothetical protein
MATDDEKRRIGGQMARSMRRPGALQDLLKDATLKRTVGYQTRTRNPAGRPSAAAAAAGATTAGLSAIAPSIPNQPLVDNDAQVSGIPYSPEQESPAAPAMRRFGDTDAYLNSNPGPGFGRVSYSDTQQGLNAAMQGNRLAGGGQGYAVAQGFGPFGRTEENQQAIENRVGQYTRAIDFIRAMRQRDMPSERDRLQGRANQRISLNQGLGAFVNQVSDRNYAREQIGAMDERETEQAKLASDQQQQQFDNELGLARLMADRFRFQTVDSTDPTTMQPVQQAYLFDQMSGQAQPMTLGQQSGGAVRRDPATGRVVQQQPDGTWKFVGEMTEGS